MQADAPERHGLLVRDNPVEWRFALEEAALGYLYLVEGLSVEDVEAVAAIHEHLGQACSAHNRADHERVAPGPWVRDVVAMVVPIEGDGHFRPSKPRLGDNGVDDIHLFLVGLGASEDHQALLGLEELDFLLLSVIGLHVDLVGRLLSLPFRSRVPRM